MGTKCTQVLTMATPCVCTPVYHYALRSIVGRLVYNFPAIFEPESLFLYSQEPTTCPYPEPDDSNLHPPIIYIYMRSILILSLLLWPGLPSPYMCFSSPHMCHKPCPSDYHPTQLLFSSLCLHILDASIQKTYRAGRG